MGKLLLDDQGRVVEIWSGRGVRFVLPFRRCIRQSSTRLSSRQFEPILLIGRLVPACTTVTVTIDLAIIISTAV